MAGYAKWQGSVALAIAADASSEAAPVLYPNAESAQIGGAPILAERINAITREPIGIEPEGHDFAFEISGWEPTAQDLGYVAAACHGAEVHTPGTPDQHVITGANASKYLNVKIDDGLDKGTNQPTESLVGARIGRFAFELGMKSFGKLAIGGFGCRLASPGAALSPTLLTGANNAPISWAAVQAGHFQTGYNDAALTDDDDMRGFSLEFTQGQAYSGAKIGDNQPDAINEGMKSLGFVISKEFSGAKALAEYQAWLSQQECAVDCLGVMGTHEIRFEILNAHVEGPYREPIGVGEESIMGTLRCRAFQSGSDPLIRITVKDSFGAAYLV